jgi:hypothetical protein
MRQKAVLCAAATFNQQTFSHSLGVIEKSRTPV